MPKLVIDDREIEVAAGTKVIEAAARLGIMIPRFCYHPALGSVGACRVCAVKCLQGPFKGIQMSCMIDAKDGLVVSTTDEEAVAFRRRVIEWLMLNHPHDCPVCDEGGHCLLQDMTVSGGHGIRRYEGNKRTYPDQYLGPLLQHEMNRCIHCYRCARFYQEFGGYRDLGVMQSANRTYFGRFSDGVLESPFSGNLSDICPTGVFTDKPSRFYGRRWDYQRAPAICLNCCLGCNTTVSARYRKVVRQEARFNQAVNGYFICDRGRYGFFYASREDRPGAAMVAGKIVDRREAVRAAGEALRAVAAASGGQAIAWMGSARNSLETQTVLAQICGSRGWRGPAFFADAAQAQKVKAATDRLTPALAVSLAQIEAADSVLVIGADPINEAPMLALALRQAARKGAAIAVLDPRPVELPCGFVHLPVHPEGLANIAAAMLRQAVDRSALTGRAAAYVDELPGEIALDDPLRDLTGQVITTLKAAARPVVVCGTEIVSAEIVVLAADAAEVLAASGKKAGLFYLLPGANAFGAGLLEKTGTSTEDIVAAIESGALKALVLVENDPLASFADRRRLAAALERLEQLVVLDYLPSELVGNANVFVPTACAYESAGMFVNQEGRLQATAAVHRGGASIGQTGGGGHPPRSYDVAPPGLDPWPAWKIAAAIADFQLPPDSGDPEAMTRWLSDAAGEALSPLGTAGVPAEGLRLEAPRRGEPFRPIPASSGDPEGESFELLLVDWTFGTEALSCYSDCLEAVQPPPVLKMHPHDARTLGLQDADTVLIDSGKGKLAIALRVAENMAPGVLVAPRHCRSDWQQLGADRITLHRGHIRKAD